MLITRQELLTRNERGESWAAIARSVGVHSHTIRMFIRSGAESKDVRPRKKKRRPRNPSRAPRRAIPAAAGTGLGPEIGALVQKMEARSIRFVSVDLEHDTVVVRRDEQFSLNGGE